MLTPGDIVLLYRHKYPKSLRDVGMWFIYDEFARYHRTQGYIDCGPIHTMVATDQRTLFEFTTPRSRFRDAREVMDHHPWKQFRYIGTEAISTPLLQYFARLYEGQPYDYMELLDFKIAGLLGLKRGLVRLFGNPAARLRVCSTGIAMLTSKSGLTYDQPINSIPPGYWANKPDEWELYNWSRHFGHIHQEVS